MMKTWVLTFLLGAFVGVAVGFIVGSNQSRYVRLESRGLAKRVIGSPGDRVEIRDKTVYVNGKSLDEPFK